HAILRRPLYRGEIVYNRTQKVMKAGTRLQRKRPESEWHRLSAPDLRIVGEDVWEAVRRRLDSNRSAYPRRSDGQLLGRTVDPDGSFKYLLSGLGFCSICGGSFIAMTRSHGRTRANFYGCGYYQKRGSTICTNSLVIQMDRLDQAVLDTV